MSGAEPWDSAACWNTHSDGGLMVLGGARARVSGARFVAQLMVMCVHPQLEEENAQLLTPRVLFQQGSYGRALSSAGPECQGGMQDQLFLQRGE